MYNFLNIINSQVKIGGSYSCNLYCRHNMKILFFFYLFIIGCYFMKAICIELTNNISLCNVLMYSEALLLN